MPTPSPQPGAHERPGRPRPRLHLDPIGGLAGDMFLGACLDLGVPLSVVSDAVSALGLDGVEVEAWPAARGGRSGTRFRVVVDGEPLEGPDPDEAAAGLEGEGVAERSALVTSADWDLVGLLGFLRASDLERPVRERSARLFRRLAIALARGARAPLSAVRFAGAPGLDFLVDLVGAAAVLEYLTGGGDPGRRPRVTCGPVFVGDLPLPGRPVPAPEVSEALRSVPAPPPGWWLRRRGAGQCLTPTGATILAEVVDEWIDPAAEPEEGDRRVGWGLGSKELGDRPNAVRLSWSGRPGLG